MSLLLAYCRRASKKLFPSRLSYKLYRRRYLLREGYSCQVVPGSCEVCRESHAPHARRVPHGKNAYVITYQYHSWSHLVGATSSVIGVHDPLLFHHNTCSFSRRLRARTQMSGMRILRRFPFALNLGTDICHVVRVRKILESSRGARFVQKILNDEERSHPKIQCILKNDLALSMTQSAKSHGLNTGVAAAHEKNFSASRATPNPDELQLAATFMAGRYDQPSTSEQYLAVNPVSPWENGLID